MATLVGTAALALTVPAAGFACWRWQCGEAGRSAREAAQQCQLLEKRIAGETARADQAERQAEALSASLATAAKAGPDYDGDGLRKQVSALADSQAAQVAERATQVMGGFAEGMLVTARQVARSAQQSRGLVSVSRNLEMLLGEMEAAADQTALRLNASQETTQEAAQTGQAGRGFAVGAGELRKLSEQSRLVAERMRGLTSEMILASGDLCTELGLCAERSLEESCQAQAAINRLRHLTRSGDESVQTALSVLGSRSQQVIKQPTPNGCGI